MTTLVLLLLLRLFAPPAAPAAEAAAPRSGPPAAPAYALPADPADAEVARLLAAAVRAGAGEVGPGERLAFLGRRFLGRPYAEHPLERPGPERLVVGLDAFDCFTLVETVLALARALEGEGTPAAFREALTGIRYREGRIEGWASRLHYTSEWLAQARTTGLLRDVTPALGGEPRRVRPDFLSRRWREVPGLARDTTGLAAIREIEARLAGTVLHRIPQERIGAAEAGIREGDVIAITSSRRGLDIEHLGIAVRVDGRVHLLHAPRSGRPVEVHPRPLADQVAGQRAQDGIVVHRP